MTKEQKDKIFKLLVEDINCYTSGKIMGADYILQRFLDILGTKVEPQESEE